MNKKSVLVMIPAYNEAKSIQSVCRAVLERGYDLVVIDDGSKDDTVTQVEKLNVTVLKAERNEGKGKALRRGFDWFLGQPYSAVILMDADGQHEVAELDQFLGAIGDSQKHLVIGNRMQNPGGMPWLRRKTNHFMSWLISIIAGQFVPDTQCGYRAIRREVLEKVAFFTDRFEIESEMILRSAAKSFIIHSIPIQSVYRDEVSQIHPIRDTMRFIGFIISYLLKII